MTFLVITYNCDTFFWEVSNSRVPTYTIYSKCVQSVCAVSCILFLTAGRDAALPKTEVCLTLVNKFEVPENDDQDINKLFIRWVLCCFSSLSHFHPSILTSAKESPSVHICPFLHFVCSPSVSAILHTYSLSFVCPWDFFH